MNNVHVCNNGNSFCSRFVGRKCLNGLKIKLYGISFDNNGQFSWWIVFFNDFYFVRVPNLMGIDDCWSTYWSYQIKFAKVIKYAVVIKYSIYCNEGMIKTVLNLIDSDTRNVLSNQHYSTHDYNKLECPLNCTVSHSW